MLRRRLFFRAENQTQVPPVLVLAAAALSLSPTAAAGSGVETRRGLSSSSWVNATALRLTHCPYRVTSFHIAGDDDRGTELCEATSRAGLRHTGQPAAELRNECGLPALCCMARRHTPLQLAADLNAAIL